MLTHHVATLLDGGTGEEGGLLGWAQLQREHILHVIG